MTGIAKVTVGALIKLDDGRDYLVRRFETPTTIAVRDLESNVTKIVGLDELRHPAPSTKRRRVDLDQIAPEKLDAAQEKYLIIKPLLDKEARTSSAIEQVAKAAGASRSTIYRWIKEFEGGSLVSNLLRKQRSDRGTTRLDAIVEKIIGDVITDYWLTPERRTASKAYRELTRRCWGANPRLTAPSLPTFVARLEASDRHYATHKRERLAAADKLTLNKGTVPFADRPYGLIQIDHTLVDIMLVDEEYRIPIGRPWLTMAIDVYSRMVAGYYISFDPPGTLGTGICVANAILSKKGYLATLGQEFNYPCMGKPAIIHLDNAREFHGKTLERACGEYGIDLMFRRIKTPRYGAHIERHLGTLALEIHALRGTTFSNTQSRGEYDSEGRAAMTLKEFERWLANLILGVYHNNPHGGTGESPLARYTRGLLGDATRAGTGRVEVVTDEERLRIDFLPMFEMTVQSYGIKIDHICYQGDVLRRWVGAFDPKSKRERRKFICRRDPRDISSILFFDPDAQTYFRIPYRNMTHPALSVWELKAVRAFLRDQGRKDIDEEEIFKALDEMRRIEEESVKTTAKTRRSDASRRALRRRDSPQPPSTSEATKTNEGNEAPPPAAPGAVLPYDEIERL